MTSSRPYLLRAIYEWILDNDCTPHILVNALHPEAQVPQDYVKDGQIVLNIAPGAVQNLSLVNDAVSFSARFQGVPNQVFVSIDAILGIYAKENGKGMMFEEMDGGYPPTDPTSPDPAKKDTGAAEVKRPSLRVVK